MLKKFKDLTEREILALAVTNEEEDGRIYGEFADALRESYPATAQMFEEMRAEESVHRDRLLALFKQRFGDHIPPIRSALRLMISAARSASPGLGSTFSPLRPDMR